MDGVIAEFEYNPISIISEKGYFGERRPMKNMIMALKMLISRNIEIHILSAVLPNDYAKQEKLQWLQYYLPEIKREKIHFITCGNSKKKIAGEGILIDDYTKNLQEWNGIAAIKCCNGINGTKGTWKGYQIDALDYPEKIVENIMSVLESIA